MKATKIEICKDKPIVNRIIRAAVPLFATKGLSAVSVKELADAAGVNIAMISYYFGGKDNLYAFVLEQQLAILQNLIDNINNEPISPMMKIKRLANANAIYHKENPYIERLFFAEILNPSKYFDSFVKNAAHNFHLFLRNCISDGIADGEFRANIEPDFAAMSLAKILNISLTAQHLFQGIMVNHDNFTEQYISQAVEIFLRGVTNDQLTKEERTKQ